MKYEIAAYPSLCELEVFTVNGLVAEWKDFGEMEDLSPDAEEYGCGDMQFLPKPPSLEVLIKFEISEDEYEEIGDKLTDALSFGNCGRCT